MLAEYPHRSMAALERQIELRLRHPPKNAETQRFTDLLAIIQEVRKLRPHGNADLEPVTSPERKTA